MATDNSVSNYLRAMVDVHTDTLKGKSVRPERVGALGPLAGLVVANGRWREDGLACVHGFLTECLSKTVEGVQTYGDVKPSIVRNVLEAMWGLSHSPLSVGEAVKFVGPGVHGSTPSRWEERLIEGDRTVDWIESKIDDIQNREEDGSKPLSSRPFWYQADGACWPPGDPYLLGKAVSDVLIDRARRALGIERSSSDTSYASLVLLEAAKHSLRQYHSYRTESSQAYRYLENGVFVEWAKVKEILEHPPLYGSSASKGRYRTQVAASVQLRMFLLKREDFLRAESKISLRVTHFPGSDLGNQPLRIRRLLESGEVETRKFVDEALCLGEAGSKADADLLMSQAALMRKTDDFRLKKYLMDIYMSARVSDISSLPDNQLATIALADHSVQLDMLNSEDAAGIAKLTVLINSMNSINPRKGLALHTLRSEIVLNNKRNATDVAMVFGGIAYRRALALEGEGWTSVIERMEVLQQVDLALAGVFVRALERSFRGNRDDRIAYYASWALWCSSLALARIAFLEQPDVGGGLPTVRHSEGRISTTGWRVQPEVIRLRTVVAVSTAIQSRLVEEAAVVKCLEGLRYKRLHRESELTAFLEQQQVEYTTAFACTLYRNLIVRRELTPGHQLDIVRVAVWIALMNGGEIPVEIGASAGIRELNFLDTNPAHLVNGGMQTVQIDIDRAVDWIHERSTDFGLISWLKRSDRVHKYLRRASEGRYDELIAKHRLPSIPSHD